MAAKRQIFVSKNNHMTKIWKSTFPMKFFNEIWFMVGEQECIYIFWNKIWKNILFKSGGQNKFCDITQ